MKVKDLRRILSKIPKGMTEDEFNKLDVKANLDHGQVSMGLSGCSVEIAHDDEYMIEGSESFESLRSLDSEYLRDYMGLDVEDKDDLEEVEKLLSNGYKFFLLS